MAKKKRPGNDKLPPGRLRIVAGKWRSRLLRIADEPGLRPTSLRIRETVFNWLAPIVTGSRCLDLFAGTGALGLEAMSRGAKELVLVEKSVPVADALRENVELLAAEGVSVIKADAGKMIAAITPQPFDIVFLDPPFADDILGDLCRLLMQNGWVSDGSLIYLEQARHSTPPDLPNNWQITHEKTAGNVRYSLAEVVAAKNGRTA